MPRLSSPWYQQKRSDSVQSSPRPKDPPTMSPQEQETQCQAQQTHRVGASKARSVLEVRHLHGPELKKMDGDVLYTFTRVYRVGTRGLRCHCLRIARSACGHPMAPSRQEAVKFDQSLCAALNQDQHQDNSSKVKNYSRNDWSPEIYLWLVVNRTSTGRGGLEYLVTLSHPEVFPVCN
ncbi:hypothetical protein C0Q70_06467 [Pomacea canaliculata]|uniref:Uncharacterized protein n=1 Tax=Pomacea canaliculata TaxID=400727 RepID=A0A2T7PP28_POMCA|nr:hypothetical protein C0Q70_06467 [Pomacea canaliculata]